MTISLNTGHRRCLWFFRVFFQCISTPLRSVVGGISTVQGINWWAGTLSGSKISWELGKGRLGILQDVVGRHGKVLETPL